MRTNLNLCQASCLGNLIKMNSPWVTESRLLNTECFKMVWQAIDILSQQSSHFCSLLATDMLVSSMIASLWSRQCRSHMCLHCLRVDYMFQGGFNVVKGHHHTVKPVWTKIHLGWGSRNRNHYRFIGTYIQNSHVYKAHWYNIQFIECSVYSHCTYGLYTLNTVCLLYTT